MTMKRRSFLTASAAAAGAGIAGFPGIWIKNADVTWAAEGEIPVGILYSLSGTTAIVERSMNQCALMAIDEINAAGGVNGRMLKPIVEDPASDPRQYSEKARKLILQDRVATIFGCYTTASRKAVLPIVEQRNSLLVWPTWYEGEECSKNIFYGGSAVPNQQLENSIPWLVNTLGKKKFFLVGSDYGFPRGMAKVSKVIIEDLGAEWVADEYLPLGHTEWASMVSKIGSSGADVIFSNVVGDSIVAFYREFRNQGYDFDKIPLCASTTTEIEIQAMGPEYALNSYVSLPYFQTVETPENERFVEAFKSYAGGDAVTHAAMESVYIGTHIWAQTANQVGDADPVAVRNNLGGQEMAAPQGGVRVDPQNLHTYLTPRIGQVREDGLLNIVAEESEPRVPLPYSSAGETLNNRICTEQGAKL